MKKFLPFIFPVAALLIVLFLGYRWYHARTVRQEGRIPQFADGVQIENLNQAEVSKLRRPVKDLNTVKLSGSEDGQGEVRYEIQDGKVYFTVMANLPELENGNVYQVWLKELNGDAKRPAFILNMDKGGYTGSAAISADTLPFEVLVSNEMKQDDQLEVVVLRGVIQKDAPQGK